MAAVTTVPGFDARALRPRRPASPRAATPRGRRTFPAARRRRIAIAVLAVGIVVVAQQAGVALGGSPLAPERRPTVSATQAIVVHPGDTLWGIAQRLAPGEDPRPIVDQLAAAHGPGPLVPGETIHWSR